MSEKYSLESVNSAQTPFVKSHFSPWLAPVVYPLACWVVLPAYFRDITITGAENLPQDGPIILAPTHRSRWDALMLGYAAGRWATGRDLRFMVTADEVKGVQGWFIHHLGGFAVNPQQPAIASLRHGVDLLHDNQSLVIFPEGGIFRDNQVHSLKPGLARLALQAESLKPGIGVKIVPVALHYGDPDVRWGCGAEVSFGQPLSVAQYLNGSAKQNAKHLTQALSHALSRLDEGIPSTDAYDCPSLRQDELALSHRR